MENFVNANCVFVHQPATSRLEAIRAISELAAEQGIATSADEVEKAFLWREEQDNTGAEDGYAVPHAKCDAINQAAVIVYKMDTRVEWPTFDGSDVDTCIALLVPGAEAGTTHVALLSKTACLLMEQDFRETVRNCQDPAEIADYINKCVNADDDVEDEDE